MPTYVSVKKALKFPRVIGGARSIAAVRTAIKRGTVTARVVPLGAASSLVSGQVDVAGLTAFGIPALRANGKKVVGGV